MKRTLPLLTDFLLMPLASLPAAEVANLRCEYLKDPLGIDVAKPRLSWQMVSGNTYHWRVRVWDDKGTVSSWSDTARWTMEKLKPGDLSARWIGVPATSSGTALEGVVIQRATYRTPDGKVAIDAAARLPGWCQPGLDTTSWVNAVDAPAPQGFPSITSTCSSTGSIRRTAGHCAASTSEVISWTARTANASVTVMARCRWRE